MRPVRRVILDTNFLMIPGQVGVDIFLELQRVMDFPYELCVMSGTIRELDDIIEKDKNEDKIAARIAKGLIAQKQVRVLDGSDDVDDDLAGLSGQDDVIVATQDMELKRRLRGKKLVLRQKKYVELI